MESGVWDVPAGKIAAVVTHLQMTQPPAKADGQVRAARDVPDIKADLILHAKPDLDWYRDLFSRVGAHWMWFSRCVMEDAELASHIHDAAVQVHSVRIDGRDEGLMELDFRVPGECELSFFGLTDALIGTGAGRWLMDHAIARAFAAPIQRFHVHTCTLDSPQALPFYMRSGFMAYCRQIEVSPDPRLSGAMARTVCPQEPII